MKSSRNFKVFNIGVIIVLVCFCIGLLISRQNNTSTSDIERYKFDTSSESYKSIERAYNKLKDYSSDYIVANVMELPESSVCYIEVVTSNGSTTEYPIDSEGNWGVVDITSSEEPQYMLFDYLTSSNELYLADGLLENGEYSWVHMPKSHAEDIKSRNLMYFDRYLNKMYNIENLGTKVLNEETGEEMTVYTAEIPASVVKEVCSIDTLGLYENIETEYSDNKQIVDLMSIYKDSLKRSMAFSDGLLTIGVSKDGMLSYLGLETGGLGNMMYYTKQIVTGDTIDARPIPDFSSSKDYMTDVEGLAGYISTFDSYEEAMKNLYGDVSSSLSSTESIISEESETVETDTILEEIESKEQSQSE